MFFVSFFLRRRCLKPRHRHRKMHIYSTLESSKKDQGTSTSHLNLISAGHLECASSTTDLNGVKLDLSTSRDQNRSHENSFQPKQRHSKGKYVENIPLQTTQSINTNNQDLPLRDRESNYSPGEDSNSHHEHSQNSSDGQSCQSQSHYQEQRRDSKPPEYSDHLTRPGSINAQPGQLIFCHSMEQMKDSMYHSMVPTLVIPAHYMRLSSDLSAMEQAVDRQQQLQHDMDGIQVSMTLPHQQNQQTKKESKQQNSEQEKADQPKTSSQEQNWSSDPTSGPIHIPVLFNESTMTQMNGELKALTDKKLLELGVKPHPLAWFVSLDGRANSLVRHSYIELGSEPFCVSAQEHHAETYPGNANKSAQRKCKEESKIKKRAEQKAYDKIHLKPPVIDIPNPSSSSDTQTIVLSTADGTESRDGTFERKGRSREHSSTTEFQRDSEDDDKDDDDENKKSPWQKREERPLMVFK